MAEPTAEINHSSALAQSPGRGGLSWSLPVVAGGGRDFQKMGLLDYTQAPAQVWVLLLKATPGLGLELVLTQAA